MAHLLFYIVLSFIGVYLDHKTNIFIMVYLIPYFNFAHRNLSFLQCILRSLYLFLFILYL